MDIIGISESRFYLTLGDSNISFDGYNTSFDPPAIIIIIIIIYFDCPGWGKLSH